MTSFTKHRRQPGGKSLLRLRLQVTSRWEAVCGWICFKLILSIFGHYIFTLSKQKCLITYYQAIKTKTKYKQKTVLCVQCHLTESLLTRLGCSSCAVQMWVYQYAEQQLAVPHSAHSAFWTMAFFSVYWFLSRSNLKWGDWGGVGVANRCSRLYSAFLTIDLVMHM